MRIYLIDDDSAVLSVLRLLIEDGGLGTVVGSSQSAVDALEDLRTCGADIVLVDLLMPEMDGITFVQKARQQFPELHFVMLSQVTSKEMVGEAYQSGVDFFIVKPINGVEVTSVLSRVDELLTMERTMRQVRSLMQLDRPAAKPEPARPARRRSARRSSSSSKPFCSGSVSAEIPPIPTSSRSSATLPRRAGTSK